MTIEEKIREAVATLDEEVLAEMLSSEETVSACAVFRAFAREILELAEEACEKVLDGSCDTAEQWSAAECARCIRALMPPAEGK